MILSALESARPALHVDTTVLAGWNSTESWQVVEVKINVAGDRQVDEAIVIIIGKSGARGPTAASRQARFLGHIGESSVAVVTVQNIWPQAGNEQIGPSIVVVIGDGPSHGETGRANSRFFGHVCKRSVVIVVIQRAARHNPLQRLTDGGRIGEVEVGPAIAVVINHDHATCHRFHDVLFLGRREVLKLDAGLGRNIGELRNDAVLARLGLRPWRRRSIGNVRLAN